MDDAYNDIVDAQAKEQEAAALRKEEFYNKDNPRVMQDLEAAARELDQTARNDRAEAAQIQADEQAATQEDSSQ